MLIAEYSPAILDAAILKLVRLTGGFTVECNDCPAPKNGAGQFFIAGRDRRDRCGRLLRP